MDARSSDENIQVFVRVRPPLSYEGVAEKSGTLCVEASSSSTVVLHSQPEARVFTFDQVAGPGITQEDVFSFVGRPIIDCCMAGYNGTIFAYGQTGSGKTFTMIGPSDDNGTDTFSHELRGVIPRSLEYLFSLINREKQKYGDLVEFLCKCSFLEIYNEQVYDLLDPASTGLHLRESIQRGVYVDGLLEQVVTSATDAYHVLTRGWTNRRVAATSMNRESSRSHAVFMLAVESKKRDSSHSVSKIRTAVLNLVDLAGSERQRDAQTVGIRLKEAGSINKSLSVLGNVIMSLVDITHGKSRHVHYRDSKLTFLLRDSLGGNAKTNLIANVHPLAKCFGETLSTLQFAKRAKMIKNKAVVNENTTGNVTQLQTEIKRLKDSLNKLRAGAMESPSDQQQVVMTGDNQLREMLTASMALRKEADQEKMMLQEAINKLEELCKRKEKSLQTSKMILKLRDAHIASLEKKRPDVAEITKDSLIRSLQDEVVQLRALLDHHPEVMRVAVENGNLKAQLQRLRAVSSDSDVMISRLKHYTLQLETQLRPHLTNQGEQCVDGTALPDTAMTDEVNKLTTRCGQLEQDLRKAELSSSRLEQHHKEKLATMEASLTAARNTNQELERTIEQLHLQHSMEKASLDTSHLRLIKAIVTPGSLKRQRRCRSATSTPSRPQDGGRETSSQQKLFFPPLSEIQNIPSSSPTDSNLLSLTPSSFEEKDIEEEVEVNARECLTEELKILQESKASLNQQLEEQQSLVVQISSEKRSLELTITDLSREMGDCKSSAAELKRELEEANLQISQVASTKYLLEDEVKDLRLCLRSADKELAESKAELVKEQKASSKRSSKLYQQVADLEQKLSSKDAECDNILQELQTLQDEMETLREETQFKQHCLGEKDDQLEEIKGTVTALELKLQRAEEQLAMEVEKGLTMTSQLEEGSRQKLSAVLSENAQLTTELIQTREDMQGELAAKQKELDAALSSIHSLTKRAETDKEALSNLIASVQAARVVEADQQAKITAMKEELKETEAKMMETALQSEKKAEELQSAQQQLVKTVSEHKKELCARDMQLEVLEDELQELTQQMQEVTSSCEDMKAQLETKQAESECLKKKLVANEVKLNELQALQQHQDDDSSLSLLSDDAGLTSYIERMESERVNHTAILQQLHSAQEERNNAIKSLQVQVAECDSMKQRCELTETQLLAHKYKMEADIEQFTKSEALYKQQLSKQASLLEEADRERSVLQQERDSCVSETREARTECDAVKERLISMEDQLERVRTQEEETFKEKESLRSQLEATLEEKARLAKECADLVKENAMVSGHQNIRQRIHFHANLKMEYHKTLEENKCLQERVRHLEDKLRGGGGVGDQICSSKTNSKHKSQDKTPF